MSKKKSLKHSNSIVIPLLTMYRFCFLLWIFFIVSCIHPENKGDSKLLARVGSKDLYENNVQYPKTLKSKSDSVTFLKVYVNRWITQELMLQKAVLNLSESSSEIDKLVEEYRASLLIHAYQQELMNQKMDTAISDEEVQQFYHSHIYDFRNDSIIVKMRFVRVSRNYNAINQLRKLIKSDNDDGLGELEKICFQNNIHYQINNDWLYYNEFTTLVPREIWNAEQFLKSNPYHEFNDEQYFYLFYISDYRLKDDIAPIELVELNIRHLILQKRKIQFIKDIENSIYKDALSRQDFINNMQ